MLVDTSCAAAADLGVTRLVVVGGVSANSRLRDRLKGGGGECGLDVLLPSLPLCTVNAAMIAYAGWCRFERGLADDLQIAAQADLSLDPGWCS